MNADQPLNIDLPEKIKKILLKTPGLSIKEIAKEVGINRQFMAGFLAAMEENGEVCSRKVGPAKIYFNNRVKNK
jgi:predicted transcriptional regulator